VLSSPCVANPFPLGKRGVVLTPFSFGAERRGAGLSALSLFYPAPYEAKKGGKKEKY
jgi:hypothetical protein